MYDYDAEDDQDLPPSRSELKRQMLALQELGKKLLELSETQLKTLSLDDDLLGALAEHKRIKSHEARRRQLQRIGKLMRTRDSETIRAALDIFDSSSTAHAQHFQNLEYWRDRLIADDAAVAEFVELWPECEIQLLRQMIRNTRQEIAAEKPPANSRKLFRYLRKLADPK